MSKNLIAPVPFGVPDELPPHQSVSLRARACERRLLFAAFMTGTTLGPPRALTELEGAWTLLLIRNPKRGQHAAAPSGRGGGPLPESRLVGEPRVQTLDWVPAERRYDLLRMGLLVAPHTPRLETRLSLRTRFLDALASGCPVSPRGPATMSRLLKEHQAGWVVPPRTRRPSPTPCARRCHRRPK